MGSGVGDFRLEVGDEEERMIDDLYVKLGSLRAGNTSCKLRQDIKQLVSKLVKRNLLTQAQGQKIFRDYIG